MENLKSPSIGKIAVALAKAQSEFSPPEKDSSNPHFKSKFASLASIRAATQPALTKHEIAVVHMVDGDHLLTMLLHASGEWIGSRAPIRPSKNDSQGIGSAVTYMKRYSLQAMLNVVGEEVDPSDDDGEAAVGRGAKPQPAPKAERSIALASKAQLQVMWILWEELGHTDERMRADLKKYYGVESSKELTVAQASAVIAELKKQKAAIDKQADAAENRDDSIQR